MSARLIQGRAYVLNGRTYRAGLVNDCRARLDPLFREARTIRPAFGEARTIHSTPESLNVSPTAALQPAAR